MKRRIKRHLLENSPWWIIKKVKACLQTGEYGEMDLVYVRQDRAKGQARFLCTMVGLIAFIAGTIIGLLISLHV